MAETTWANDIAIDQSVLDQASATRATTGARKLSKHEVVLALSDTFGIGATRKNASLDPISAVVVRATPIGNPKVTNERYNVLATIVEQLPEDFWYGTTSYANGEERVVVPAFASLNILPFLQALESNPDAPNVNGDALKATTESVKTHLSAIVEMNLSQQGFAADSVEVTSAKTRAEASTALPTVEINESSMQPAASGNFMVDQFLAEDMSPQEFAQTYGQTPLLDLANKELTFGLSGLMSGGNLGGDDGISVYEAIRWFYSLNFEQVSALQEDLARAGYFDQVGQSYLQVGDPSDANTRQAWDLFLVDVVRSGAQATPETVMNDRIQNFVGNRAPAQGYIYTDKAALQSMGNQFAQAFAGRNLDYVEMRSFYKMVREWEREAALGVTFAQENEQVDVRARAEEYFNSELRVEQAKNIASKWGDFGQE